MFEIKEKQTSSVFKNLSKSLQAKSETGGQLGLLELGIVSLSLFRSLSLLGPDSLPFQIVKAICLGILIFLTLVMLASYPIAARYDLSWKRSAAKRAYLGKFNFPWFFLMLAILFLLVMVLYLSAFTLLLGGSAFYPLWFWFAGLSPSRIDGENFRQIPVG